MIAFKTYIFKLFLLILFSVFLYGCPVLPKTIVDNGPLPESAKLVVPYKNGENYKFKFSNGLVINFTAERETVDAIDNGCAECFNFEQHYQRDIICFLNLRITKANGQTISSQKSTLRKKED